ncbi:MAG: outer membrane protein assembly factor BamA [Gammaproteobacteria bacterium]|nr:outer membrane protein assembly factor BamA [Gammaproteobacteria bacterium]
MRFELGLIGAVALASQPLTVVHAQAAATPAPAAAAPAKAPVAPAKAPAPAAPVPAKAPAAKPGPAAGPSSAAPAAEPVIPAPDALQSSSDPADFVVGDIRVQGLQRISEGTVFNYLPVNIGDHLDAQKVREAMRALYATGFFRDVEMRRQGNTLLVVVIERPSIEKFDIKGNKDIKTPDLEKSLRDVGLAQGKIFDRSVLDEVKQYLTDQYFSRGKYAVQIDAKVTDRPGNKVDVLVQITEGKRAVIREINIVGDTAFKEKDILSTLELKTPNWLSWYKQDDRYSRESLQGDLEKIRSYFMDRGYANFRIDSTQVTITPEKHDMFITVNIHQGEVFRVSKIKLAGTMVVPEKDLRKLLLIKPGEIFSRKLITKSQELMSYRLGADGYAFSKIDPVPTADPKTKTVSLTFYVEPGNRVYVRHIEFTNESAINDETLRREMRQLEGGWLSNSALERSKERIQRLPYVKKVTYDTKPVPGSADMVDVDYKIKEGLPGQFGGGIGYSAAYGISLNGNFVHSNFLGTGDRVALEVNGGKYSKTYTVSETNPYTTIDGVSRTTSFTYRDITQFVSSSSVFGTKQLTAALQYAYPISEYQYVELGLSANKNTLVTSQGYSSQQAVNWVKQNGGTFSRVIDDTNGDGVVNSLDSPYTVYGTNFYTYELSAGWSMDSRNRALFADRGMRNALSGRIAIPPSGVRYYGLSYQFVKYQPLFGRFVLSDNVQLDYAAAMGRTTGLPPYMNYFAGGPDSVRGYMEATLGPRDNIGLGNPYGGNLLTVNRLELIMPVPEKWQDAARVSLFYDIGNVFQTGTKTHFLGVDDTTPVTYHFSYANLKRSTGLAVEWLAPLGLFRFSYAIPLNPFRGDTVHFGDQTERFQFSIGQAF